jgi:hypothetical protein
VENFRRAGDKCGQPYELTAVRGLSRTVVEPVRHGNVLELSSSVGNCEKDDAFGETVLGSQGNHRKDERIDGTFG